MSNKNLFANSGVAAVSFIATGLEHGKVISSAAGLGLSIVVQPAVWALTETRPDAVDMGLYGGGIIATAASSLIGGMALAVTGVWKGYNDDCIDQNCAQARASEPLQYRQFIQPCARYSRFGGADEHMAQTIASKGGTVWQHPNGLWVYIADATGKLVCNYQPQVAARIFQPFLPLCPILDGFKWRPVRG